MSFQQTFQRILSASPVWLAVWIGLAVLTVGLLILMRTRWGQSRPMRKCAVLSLLAHVLLACLATTVKIVSFDIQEQPRTTLRVIDDMRPPNQPPAEESQRPWDPKPTAAVVAPSIPPLERSSVRPFESPTLPDLHATETVLLQSSMPPDWPPSMPAASSPDLPASPPADLATISPQIPPTLEPQLPPLEPQETTQPPTPQDPTDNLATPQPQDPTAQIGSVDARDNESAAGMVEVRPSPHPLVSDPGELTPVNAPPTHSDRVAQIEHDSEPSIEPNSPPLHLDRKLAPSDGGVRVGRPAAYQSRSVDQRAAAIAEGGGSAETEAAVEHALTWLAKAQSADGRWDADRHAAGRERRVLGHDRRGAGLHADAGVSGLALLSFLGSDQTHLTGQYTDTVRDGIKFLTDGQRPDGSLSQDATVYARMYCHAMATFAISEAYAITGDSQLRSPVQRAAAFCIRSQDSRTGGWRYRPGELGDTSQHGWQLMALFGAQQGGIPIPATVWSGGSRFLDRVTYGTYRGLAAYRPQQGVSPTMTAEAMYCRQLLARQGRGFATSRQANAEARRYLLQNLPDQHSPNLYYWYYATLFLHATRLESADADRAWQTWNEALKTSLLARQVRQGPATGSWNPDTVWGGYGGRVYSTAMAALCLEVYYRYRPDLVAERDPPPRR